jgi:hypothetical protein
MFLVNKANHVLEYKELTCTCEGLEQPSIAFWLRFIRAIKKTAQLPSSMKV